MSSIIEAKKKTFAKLLSMIEKGTDVDLLYADYKLVAQHEKKVVCSETEWERASEDYRVAKIKSLLNGDDDDATADDQSDSDDDVDDDEPNGAVSLASVAAFLLGASDKTSVAYRFVNVLSKEFANTDFSEIRKLCTRLGKMQELPDDEPFGNLNVINNVMYDEWAESQKGATLTLSPLSLWNILERIGKGCVIRRSINPGQEYLEYTHNGYTIYCYDRFMVHASVADGTQAPVEMVNAFLKGLKFKGKYLQYERVQQSSYLLALAFFTLYRVTVRDKVYVCDKIKTPAKDRAYVLPKFSVPVLKAIDVLMAKLRGTKARATDAVSTFETTARIINQSDDEVYGVAIASLQATQEVQSVEIESLTDTLTALSKLGVDAKTAGLKQAFGTQGKAVAAKQVLSHARDLRNASDVGAIVNHNVASVHGHNLPEWVDTYFKGRHMVHLIKESGHLVDDAPIFVYGVAYGHMTPVFNELASKRKDPNAKGIVYVDNAKAKNATETFVRGDVFEHTEIGAIIADDSNSHSLPTSKQAQYRGMTGDHAKVANFIKCNARFFVSKVSMESFVTETHLNAWNSILYPNGRDRKYSFRLCKLGKLHNMELFLVGTRAEEGVDHMGTIRGDLQVISHCIETANYLIMMAQQKGLRLGLHDYDPSAPRNTIGVLWRKLIRALPVAWVWYFADADKDIEVKTIEQAHEEESQVNVEIIDDSPSTPTMDWTTSVVSGADVAARLAKKRLKNMAYIDKIELPVSAKTELGYGCEDELQAKITSGEVRKVKWNARELMWEVAKNGDPPLTKDKTIDDKKPLKARKGR